MENRSPLLALCYYNFGPYHLARLQGLAKLAAARGLRTMGLELASKGKGHPWTPGDNHTLLDIHTLFPHLSVENVPIWQSVKKMWITLNRLDPQALGLSGYTKPAMLTALVWARWKRRVAIILMASKADDKPRRPLVEWVKKRIMALYDGALVGGTPQRDYALQLGLPPGRIFLHHNVIDNHYFLTKSDWARKNSQLLREKYHIPDNYFIAVTRFDEKKNILRLFHAYLQYSNAAKDRSWGLVLCGSGPLDNYLRQQVSALKLYRVHFTGFMQIEDLPNYYGLGNCLVFPSLGDTWGLVVNEAMAAGLPVLVSRACGCARDLVQEGVNGFTFDPYDVAGLAQLMHRMASGELNLEAMGEASRRIISHWTPEIYGENFLNLIEAVTAQRGNPPAHSP